MSVLNELLGTIPAWVEDGLCGQTDPELFFPINGVNATEPKAVCARCPVRSDCLEYALENDERFGVWGGLSERERRDLKKTTTTTKDTTMTTHPVDDFEVCEGCYASFAPTEVDKEGLCDACAIAPAPKDAVKIVGRPPLPGYAADAGALLAATEGHNDPLVRDVRKIAAQALKALAVAKQQYDRLQSSTERAIAAVSTETKPAVRKPSGKRDPLATTVLMQQHGTTPAQVREWAAAQGIEVAGRGNPSKAVIEQYIAAVGARAS